MQDIEEVIFVKVKSGITPSQDIVAHVSVLNRDC